MSKRRDAELDEHGTDRGPMPNAPGPEATAADLRAHYRAWLAYTAAKGYDDRIYMCAWCGRTDVDLTVGRPGQRGEPTFCSERCRDAKLAYEDRCWPKPKYTDEELERAEARAQKARRRARRKGTAEDYGTGPVRV